MEQLTDYIVELSPPQNFFPDHRVIEVDLKGKLNFSVYELNPSFSFNSGAFNSVAIDKGYRTRVRIAIRNEIILSNIAEEIAINYSANSILGDTASGRILFPDVEFDIGVAPISFDLDFCCELPNKIIIDVRNYNGNLPISLVSVGSNDTDAGTVTLEDVTGSDYNENYNSDYGGELHQLIVYTFNSGSNFWKTVEASDTFQYNISYKGKTASNFITIRNKPIS